MEEPRAAYRYREVAELLGLSERKVKALAYEGLLRTVRLGRGSVRIPREAIVELLRDPAVVRSEVDLPPHA